MSDDQGFNSMQAQLGLVGGSGSFNPLGIATPAPPPAPMVRHPGELSQDIVRQTQTQMATTLQTTSAMRLGGMGGMAFGGASGMGMGAVGAFSQQYQQNMAGMQSQHIAPYSAQMMGMMGGMGGGFQPGMMPNPAMMTSPGMGIYRPFAPPPPQTVSAFQQMPLFQTPLTPMPPPPQFQTPMDLANNMAIQAGQRRTGAAFAAPGVAARTGVDIGAGFLGAGAGAALGARFGPMGAAIGGTIGMAAGAFGSEHFGVGAAAQGIADRINPFRTMAIRQQQLMSASQDWVGGGADLNMLSGRGLSVRGATHLGRKLEDTAYSSRFRRETGGAFSAQDLTKITNVAGQEGLLNDTQSVGQIHDRVKTVAKSLVSFMKIANEPNVVEALKSMGKMRQMGMSVGETMDMAMEARMFSKMAGTSVRGIMETGGAQGAMMFQQQGLSAGLGMRMGMGAMGMAHSAVAGGAFSQQRLAMMGGVQGVAQHEIESSAAFLKQPMMAAALSTMGRSGSFGVDGRAIRDMATGRMDIGQMATRGVDNLLSAVSKQGIGALGMAQVQGTEIQDAIGRALGPQGLATAQLNQINQTRKMMGLDQNPGGFITAAKAMGLTDDQAKMRMSQASSPGFFENQRRQLQVQMMEARGLENEEFERNRLTFRDRIGNTGAGRYMKTTYGNLREFGEGVSGFFQGDAELSQARSRGQIIVRTERDMLMSDEELRSSEQEGMTGERARQFSNRFRPDFAGQQNLFQLGSGRGIGRSRAIGGLRDTLGGHPDDLRQYRQSQGGVAAALGGGVLESSLRVLTYGGGVANALMVNGEEVRRANLETNEGAAVFGKGMSMTSDERGAAANEVGAGLTTEFSSIMAGMAKKRAQPGGGWGLLGPLVGAIAGGAIGGRQDRRMNITETRAEAKKFLESKGKKPTEKEIDKIISAGSQSAALLAGKGGADSFRSFETIGAAARESSLAELQDSEKTRVDKLFGAEGSSSNFEAIFGSEEKARKESARQLFLSGKSEKAGLLASLMAAEENGDKNAASARQKLEAEMIKAGENDEVTRAYTMMGKAVKDGNIDHFQEIGSNLVKQSDGKLEDIKKLAKGTRKLGQANKAAVRRQTGIERLIGKEGEEFKGKSGVDILQGLVDSGGGDDLTPQMTELVDKFESASTDGEREDIAKQFEDLAFRNGTTAEREAKSGHLNAYSLAKNLMSSLSSTESEVGKNFPNVDTFDEASRRMLQAANLLAGRSDRTIFNTGDTGTGGIT